MNIFYFAALSIIQICTGIQETSEKYLIETKYVSPFMMVAFEGIVGFICTSIMLSLFIHRVNSEKNI